MNVCTDFVAASADCRADARDEIRGPGAECIRKRFDTGHRRSFREAAPAGVNGGNCSGARIDNQQRNTVGGLNGDRNIRVVCEHDVRVGPFAWTRLDGVRTVHLVNASEAFRANADRVCHVRPTGF
jgi:hypothetical protein